MSSSATSSCDSSTTSNSGYSKDVVMNAGNWYDKARSVLGSASGGGDVSRETNGDNSWESQGRGHATSYNDSNASGSYVSSAHGGNADSYKHGYATTTPPRQHNVYTPKSYVDAVHTSSYAYESRARCGDDNDVSMHSDPFSTPPRSTSHGSQFISTTTNTNATSRTSTSTTTAAATSSHIPMGGSSSRLHFAPDLATSWEQGESTAYSRTTNAATTTTSTSTATPGDVSKGSSSGSQMELCSGSYDSSYSNSIANSNSSTNHLASVDELVRSMANRMCRVSRPVMLDISIHTCIYSYLYLFILIACIYSY
jgi:hypothetical protein